MVDTNNQQIEYELWVPLRGTNVGWGVFTYPTAALLRSLQWVSDGYVSPRDTAEPSYILYGADWRSAMGGCGATARRHSLLSLPRLLVNYNELRVPRSGTYIMKPTASCEAAQLWVRASPPSKYSSQKGD